VRAGITSVPPKISVAGLLSTGAEAITRHAASAQKSCWLAAKQLPSMTEARALERQLKRKKNPQLAISALNSTEKSHQ